MLNTSVDVYVKKARKDLNIENYPGNLFDYFAINKEKIKNRFFVFKKKLGDMSGFIGYSQNNDAIICINYERPIGHQNLTLAHELGHCYMHLGQVVSDSDAEISNIGTGTEKEAFEFAIELLYPREILFNDRKDFNRKSLLNEAGIEDFKKQIDILCHKHFLSFRMAASRILFSMGIKGDEVKNIIKRCGRISELDEDFYLTNSTIYNIPSEPEKDIFCGNVKKLIHNRAIGKLDGELIIRKYQLED